MKKIKLLLLFMLISFCAKAQLNGSFINGNDGMVYFALTNTTNYTLQFQWYVVNDNTQEQQGNVNMISSGETLYFGPQSIGWKWLSGERFIAILSNGQSGQWICPNINTSNTSFRGSSYIKTSRTVHVVSESGSHIGDFYIYSHNSKRYIKFKGDWIELKSSKRFTYNYVTYWYS